MLAAIVTATELAVCAETSPAVSQKTTAVQQNMGSTVHNQKYKCSHMCITHTPAKLEQIKSNILNIKNISLKYSIHHLI